MTRRKALVGAASLAALLGLIVARGVTMRPSAAEPPLASVVKGMAGHHAAYDLTLAQSNGTVVGASGKMSFDLSDACDGWTSRQRLQMTIENRDTQPVEMVSDYATFESKDGKHLDFRMRQVTEGAVTQQVAGDATLDHPGGSGEIHYTLPKNITMKLPPGTVFPTWHTAHIIAAAVAGQKFLTLPLFDGTGADGVQDSSVVITSWGKNPMAPFPPLAGLPSGRVHVAFFSPKEGSGLPDYEVGMRYWLNGVADDLRMDFGNFTMAGKMTGFTLQKPHCSN